jgi:mono/diheme cytochrome c family protein
MGSHRQTKTWIQPLGFLVVTAAGWAGCARPVEPVPAVSSAVAELSAGHQRQIATAMQRLFGSTLRPRLLVPAEDGSQEDGELRLVDALDPDRLRQGAAAFKRRCAGCHGEAGDGNGVAAAYLQPRPRDYRPGVFKFTSTPYGAKPTRTDLERIVVYGAKGTSMPAFRWLPDEELQALIDFVMVLSYRGEVERSIAQIASFDYEPEDEIAWQEFTDAVRQVHERWQSAERQVVMPASVQPPYSDETIVAGRRAFLTHGCSKCHGEDGRGQTEWLSSEFLARQQSLPEEERIQINYDTWGNVAPAADLTAGMLHGGRRSIDIYRRIYTGINGTPMPAFGQALAAEPDTIWHLTHYILSVVERRQVEGLDTIQAPPTVAVMRAVD